MLRRGDPATALTSTVSADAQRAEYRDDRTKYDRAHLLWRNSVPALSGRFRFDVEGFWVQQDPASPVPRQGIDLGIGIPLDANHNPRGAKLNERRLALTGGYERPVGSARWATTLSLVHSTLGTLRGFLTDVSNTDPNANGFRQNVYTNDLYFDTHLESQASSVVHWVAGIDDLIGSGRGVGGDFDYLLSQMFRHLLGLRPVP